MEDRKRHDNSNQRDIRCPVHNCLLGRYDARKGVAGVTFYCRKCKREYTITIKPTKKITIL